MHVVIIHFIRTIRNLRLVKSQNPNRISNIEEGNFDWDDHTPSPETNPSDSANFNANAVIPFSTTIAAETTGKRALPSRKIFQAFKQLVSPLTPTFRQSELSPVPSYASQPLSGETTLGRPSSTTPGSHRFRIWTSPIRPFSAPPLPNFGTASTRSQGTRTGTGTTMAHLASPWPHSPISPSPSTPSQYIPMQPRPSGSRLVAPTYTQLEPVPDHEYRQTIHHVASKDSIHSNDSRRDSIGISEQDPEDDPERYLHSSPPRPLPHPPYGFAPARDSNHLTPPLTSNRRSRHRNSLSLSIHIPPLSPISCGAHRKSKSGFMIVTE
jgi:hypothetical protein